MAELTKIDPVDLLGHADAMKDKERIDEFIKTKGFKDEADLTANGTAEDKEMLQRYKDMAVKVQDHHDQLEGWTNLVNSLVDKVNELNGRADVLEKKP